jgi:hypothetical protein
VVRPSIKAVFSVARGPFPVTAVAFGSALHIIVAVGFIHLDLLLEGSPLWLGLALAVILVLPRLLPPATAVDVSVLTPVTEADANSVGYATASARTFRVELSYLDLLLLLPPIPTAGGPCGTPESESFTDNIPFIDKVLLPYGPCAGSRTLTFLVSKCK